MYLRGPDNYGLVVAESSLYTHEAVTNDYTTRLGLTLPSEVLIFAEGFRVSITFAASGLLGPGLSSPPLGAIAASVANQLRRDDEEHDWDDDD